jgi:hypothetical protein
MRPMPRRARIDAPGALHHIICQEIERNRIFQNELGRNDFLNRLSELTQETETRCFNTLAKDPEPFLLR